MTPAGDNPACWIDPLVASTKVLAPFPGSWLGTIHGFTQRGFTGIIGLEPEGLNASAVAAALTVVPEYLLPNKEKTRAKKIGRFVRCTFTVTVGFTLKSAPRPEQSVVGPPELPAP
jgi:hypothetical protein